MRAFAASRYAWNWGKEILDAEYHISRVQYRETGEKYKFTHARELKKLFNKQKPDWIKDKTASATQEAFDDLQRGIQRYFNIQKGKIKINLKHQDEYRKDGMRHGWLNWRSKKKHNSFRVTNIYLKFDGPNIRYNANVGFIRMCETLRFEGKIMNATLSYDGEWFWASVQVDIERSELEPKSGIVGIDLGITYLAVTSDGLIQPNPKAYYQVQAKMRRMQRKLARQRQSNNPECYNEDGTAKKGKRPLKKSNQMKRTEQKIKRTNSRIRDIRRNAQHQLTAKIARQYGLIVLEDLNVNGMLKNKKLAKAISDAGFSEIRRQFEYKADYHSAMVGVVDRWFPSSKLCSGCGDKKLDLNLNNREWTCEHCGQQNERDLNAAINLKKEGIQLFVNPDYNRP